MRAALGSLGFEEIQPDWFRLEDVATDVVQSVGRKIFSVAERVSQREFRAALAKHLGRRDLPTPPTAVIGAVALRIPFIRRDGEHLVRTRSFNARDELNGSERALYNYFAEHGPVATFQELYEANLQAGYRTITLAVLLKRSPVIRKVKVGLYTLVGQRPSQLEIEAAEARVSRVDARPDLRFRPDSTVTCSFNVGPWLLYGGVFASALLKQFQGQWRGPSGETIRVGPQFVTGLEPMISELQIGMGERVELVLNTEDRTIQVHRVAQDG
jgi:hypothetical protein